MALWVGVAAPLGGLVGVSDPASPGPVFIVAEFFPHLALEVCPATKGRRRWPGLRAAVYPLTYDPLNPICAADHSRAFVNEHQAPGDFCAHFLHALPKSLRHRELERRINSRVGVRTHACILPPVIRTN